MPFGATPSRWCVCQFHHFRFGIKNLKLYSHRNLDSRPGFPILRSIIFIHGESRRFKASMRRAILRRAIALELKSDEV